MIVKMVVEVMLDKHDRKAQLKAIGETIEAMYTRVRMFELENRDINTGLYGLTFTDVQGGTMKLTLTDGGKND